MAVEDAPRTNSSTEGQTIDVSHDAQPAVRESFLQSWQRRIRERTSDSPLGQFLFDQDAANFSENREDGGEDDDSVEDDTDSSLDKTNWQTAWPFTRISVAETRKNSRDPRSSD